MIQHNRIYDSTSRNSSHISLLFVLMTGVFLLACSLSTPTPVSVLPPTSIAVTPATSSATLTMIAVSETPTTAPTGVPESPTPSCGAPAGWVIYTVRPGDNLFRLSIKTNTSVEQIKFANCLTSDIIVVGNQLYLPFIPPVDTSIPPQPTATSGCPSAFNCSNNALPPLVIAPGGPNDPGFKPCSTSDGNPKGFPWISVETEKLGSNDLQRGQRAYYFACEFSDPNTITAQMIGPGGTQTLSVLTTIPNPDLQMNTARRVIPWNATCDLPMGSYLLNVGDGNGNQSQLSFNLTETVFQRILTIPQSSPVGTSFQIYYCGYPAQANQNVTVDFYYGVKRTDAQGGYDFFQIDSWSILINANGWAVQTLQSSSGDPSRPYLINDREEALKGYDLFWLLP